MALGVSHPGLDIFMFSRRELDDSVLRGWGGLLLWKVPDGLAG